MSESSNKVQILVAIIGALAVLGGAFISSWDKIFQSADVSVPLKQQQTSTSPETEPVLPDISEPSEQQQTSTSLSQTDFILPDGFWESQSSGKVREIRLMERGLRLESGGNTYYYDQITTNIYRREKSDGASLTLEVVDADTIRQIASEGGVHIWTRVTAE
ncbi:MAG: hypothetical protein AAGA46_11390 [Cyanobacteria bacterium P01_F01_bin.13]